MGKKRIGDVLIERGLLKAEQLHNALEVQREKGGRLGDILIGLGVLTEESFQQFLAEHFQLPYLEQNQLLNLQLTPELLRTIPYQTALQYLVLPFSIRQATLEVVSLAPLSPEDAAIFLQKARMQSIEYSLATRPNLSKAIRFHYGRHIKKETSSPQALRTKEPSIEMLTLRKEGHCTNCGFPTAPSDLVCAKCGTSLRDLKDPFLGQLVGKKWQLTNLLGEGGMGIVYEGFNIENKQRCAVKLLRTQLKRDDAVIQRFSREVQILRKLQHPGIIEVFEYAHHEALGFYLVMELLKGCTFSEYLEKMGTELPLSEIYEIISQVCDAMEHAHQQGIVHRDLKPENIFLVGGPEDLSAVKMLDFGIAKIQEYENQRLTQTGTTLGTPHYLSPEQAVAKDVDHRSDIYSLSVLMFELLTGEMLFDADSPFQYLMRHVYAEPRTIRQTRPDRDYPQSLVELVHQGLAKNPAHRPSSMNEFKQRLGQSIGPDQSFLQHEYSQTSVGSEATVSPSVVAAPAQSVPTKPSVQESLPSYILPADEWDDEQAEQAQQKKPNTPAPILSSRPIAQIGLRSPAKPPVSGSEPASRAPVRGRIVSGAVWEDQHKKERRRRLLLWTFLLLCFASFGVAVATYPQWKSHFFPTPQEEREAIKLWQQFHKLSLRKQRKTLPDPSHTKAPPTRRPRKRRKNRKRRRKRR